MHPILRDRRRLFLYLASWAPVAAMLAALLHRSAESGWPGVLALTLPVAFLYAFLCLASWYPVRSLRIGQTPFARIAATHGAGAVLSVACWLAAVRLWAGVCDSAFGLGDSVGLFKGSLPILVAFGLLLYFLAASVFHLLESFEQSREAESRSFKLEILHRESELKLLRAQVDPHFLFNSLNSVAALTHSDPAGARAMCLELAEFLRQGQRLGSRSRITLAEEFALARSFLAVEKVRFGPRLLFVEAMAPDCAGCLIPPLLLQPLVENAVRHGISRLISGGSLRLEARAAGDQLQISVENPIDPESSHLSGQGLGLANVRRRLETIYGPPARLDIRRSEDSFRVELFIPFEIEERDQGENGAAGSRDTIERMAEG